MNFDNLFNDILDDVYSNNEKTRILTSLDKRQGALQYMRLMRKKHPTPLTHEQLKRIETVGKHCHEFDIDYAKNPYITFWGTVDKEPPFDVYSIVTNVGEDDDDHIIEITEENEPELYKEVEGQLRELADSKYEPYVDDRSDDYD